MKFVAFLNSLPTTKIRIIISLILSVYVIISAVTKAYDPTYEILAFLLLQQGIDVAQYSVKTKASGTTTSSTESTQ